MYLDAGTNNEQYLHDPLYLGLRETQLWLTTLKDRSEKH